MHIYRGLSSVPDGMSTVVSVGKFDGVHLGHQEVISAVRKRAQELGCQSAVVTFDPHPYLVLRQASPLMILTPLNVKLDLLAQLGLDAVVVLPFTPELAEMSAEDFVRYILVEKLGVREIHEGANFRFGKSASAGCEYLQEAGTKFGFGVQIHPPVHCSDYPVSSSVIRFLLANRKHDLVKLMLAQSFERVRQNWQTAGDCGKGCDCSRLRVGGTP